MEIQKYLIPEVITSEFLHQEEVRIEQWRQEMTAQGLELTRRQLEIETHRDQLQELENSLKQEKEKLELIWLQLQQKQRELEGI
jgi:chromosome segregation ATPase